MRLIYMVIFIGSKLSFGETAVESAIRYLSAEVPRWNAENHCFSCHNNGDGARALYLALRMKQPVPSDALKDTNGWLTRPDSWGNVRSSPAFSDQKLARIQFAYALAMASDADITNANTSLVTAAESLLPLQEESGAWLIEGGEAQGSPATYGTVLATYVARNTLERADRRRFRESIARATRWLIQVDARNVLDAAAVLLALPDREQVRKKSMALLMKAQTTDGGWGPIVHAQAEPFDTAVVLLALQGINKMPGVSEMIQRGRDFLIAIQQPSGGWQETTRPAGSQSYAQHISTSAWATIALLSTGRNRE